MSVQLYLFLKWVAIVNPEACISSAEQATLILIEPEVQHFEGLLPHCDNVFAQQAPGWSDASQTRQTNKGQCCQQRRYDMPYNQVQLILWCSRPELTASRCRMLSKVNAGNRKADLRKTARDHQADKSVQRQRLLL